MEQCFIVAGSVSQRRVCLKMGYSQFQWIIIVLCPFYGHKWVVIYL